MGLGFKPRVNSLSTPNGRPVRARDVCGEHPGSPAEKGACNPGGRELTDKKGEFSADFSGRSETT